MDIIFTSGGGAFQKYLAEFTVRYLFTSQLLIQRYVSRFVFRIPDSVTLPVHHLVQNVNAKELATNEAYNFAQEEKKLRAKEKEIILVSLFLSINHFVSFLFYGNAFRRNMHLLK